MSERINKLCMYDMRKMQFGGVGCHGVKSVNTEYIIDSFHRIIEYFLSIFCLVILKMDCPHFALVLIYIFLLPVFDYRESFFDNYLNNYSHMTWGKYGWGGFLASNPPVGILQKYAEHLLLGCLDQGWYSL